MLDKNGKEISDEEVKSIAKSLTITEEGVRKWIEEGFLRKVEITTVTSNDELDRQVHVD